MVRKNGRKKVDETKFVRCLHAFYCLAVIVAYTLHSMLVSWAVSQSMRSPRPCVPPPVGNISSFRALFASLPMLKVSDY